MMLSRVTRWLSDEPRHRTGLRALQIAVGLVILARLTTEWRYVGYFWGPRGLQGQSTTLVFGAHLGHLIDRAFATMAGTWAIVGILAFGAAGLVSGWQTRLCSIITAIALVSVDSRLLELGDGGDNVMRLVVIYMVVALPNGARHRPGQLRVWFHNLAILTIMAQVIILYTTAGLAKAHGPRWYAGTALYLINQVEWFSHPSTRDLFKSPVVTSVGTYATVLFQVWFPMAMFSRFKQLWVLIGMAMHIGIAVTMGLWMFSAVMIGLDLMLISDEEYRAIGRRLAVLVGRARRRLQLPQPTLVLYFDGFCPHCVGFVRLVRSLDVRRAIDARSFRHDESYRDFGLSASDVSARMHAIVISGTPQVRGGFAAVETLVWRLPAAWFLVPLLAAIRWLGVGEAAYDWCAARRVIIADARSCSTACSTEVRALGGRPAE